MRRKCKWKNRVLAGLMAVTLLSGVFSYAPKVQAKNNPYASPWGILYRTPEGQNKYGRWWWQKLGKQQGGNISIDSYYTYGSAASVEHIYKHNGKRQRLKETDSSMYGDSNVECFAGKPGKGISTTFHAGAYGINFDKKIVY